MKQVGLIAYSFSLQEGKEPNPCNRRLAAEVERIVAHYRVALGIDVVVVAQWEIARALTLVKPIHTVRDILILDNTTSDTPEITAQAVELFFMPHDITEVIIVAQPFLQIMECKMEAEKRGMEIINEEIRPIGFDPNSDQWWCRGPIRFLTYAAIQAFGGMPAPKYAAGAVSQKGRSLKLRQQA